MSSSKKSDIGTKLMNELMVDIIGAVIPGLLFIIVIAISIGVPCCIYIGPNLVDKLVELLRGSGWWVLLIISIIFSYVIGQIFYRADITVPDGKDVKRQVKEFVKKTVKQKLDEKELNALIKKQIVVLCNNLEEGAEKIVDSEISRIYSYNHIQDGLSIFQLSESDRKSIGLFHYPRLENRRKDSDNLLNKFNILYKACKNCRQKNNYNNIRSCLNFIRGFCYT